MAFLSGCLSPRDRIFTFANAGQTKPLLRRGAMVIGSTATGRISRWGSAGPCTTIAGWTSGRAACCSCLTDGFTEAMNEAREAFGPERVEQAAAADDMTLLSAAEILTRLTTLAQAFAGNAAQHDDMTLVVIEVL